jgi:hypothetical protein
MRPDRSICVFGCLLAAAALLGGCGSGSPDKGGSGGGSVENTPAPPKSDFPPAKGLSLSELLKTEAKPSPLVVLPAAKVFYTGENRYPFGIFETDRSQVGDAKVALYFSKVPKLHPKNGKLKKGEQAQARIKALEEPAIGPFPASIESLETQPAFRAATTADDPNAATAVYSTQVDFPSNGEWRVAAVVDEDGQLTGTLMPSAIVGEFHRIPRPGDEAPHIHTLTPEDVGGDLSKITTRIPPDTQNRVDYADVLGKEPILLLFATPQFCQSRVCGPVVDVAEQVKQEYGDEAAFIHNEIWKENDPTTEEVQSQVKAFHLPSEPWLFAIGRDGKVKATIEGAFGVDLMTKIVKQVTSE